MKFHGSRAGRRLNLYFSTNRRTIFFKTSLPFFRVGHNLVKPAKNFTSLRKKEKKEILQPTSSSTLTQNRGGKVRKSFFTVVYICTRQDERSFPSIGVTKFSNRSLLLREIDAVVVYTREKLMNFPPAPPPPLEYLFLFFQLAATKKTRRMNFLGLFVSFRHQQTGK